MDSLDLLAREDEYKKLNKELKKKTQSLIKEIEHAMQKRDIFSEFSPNLTLSPVHTNKKHTCDTHRPVTPQKEYKTIKKKAKNSTEVKRSSAKFENGSYSRESSNKFENGTVGNGTEFKSGNENVTSKNNYEENSIKEDESRISCDCCISRNRCEDIEFLYAFVSINVKDKVLPQSFLKDRPSVESLCKFLSSKVKLMQEQIDKMQNTLDNKVSQCHSHLSQLAELESERLTLLNRCNSIKSGTADMKAKYMALQKRYDEKERLYVEQRSLADKLSCEVKQLRTKNSSLEAKCATHQNTVDVLNQQLEVVKRAEKEFRSSTRTLSASHESTISRLQSQIKAQAARIDKQMALIDNLRRQNVLLTTEAAVKALEKEYFEYLQKDF